MKISDFDENDLMLAKVRVIIFQNQQLTFLVNTKVESFYILSSLQGREKAYHFTRGIGSCSITRRKRKIKT